MSGGAQWSGGAAKRRTSCGGAVTIETYPNLKHSSGCSSEAHRLWQCRWPWGCLCCRSRPRSRVPQWQGPSCSSASPGSGLPPALAAGWHSSPPGLQKMEIIQFETSASTQFHCCKDFWSSRVRSSIRSSRRLTVVSSRAPESLHRHLFLINQVLHLLKLQAADLPSQGQHLLVHQIANGKRHQEQEAGASRSRYACASQQPMLNATHPATAAPTPCSIERNSSEEKEGTSTRKAATITRWSCG